MTTIKRVGAKRFIYTIEGAPIMRGFTMTVRANLRTTADRKADRMAARFGEQAAAKFIKEI